jgi:hypothetical protein
MVTGTTHCRRGPGRRHGQMIHFEGVSKNCHFDPKGEIYLATNHGPKRFLTSLHSVRNDTDGTLGAPSEIPFGQVE